MVEIISSSEKKKQYEVKCKKCGVKTTTIDLRAWERHDETCFLCRHTKGINKKTKTQPGTKKQFQKRPSKKIISYHPELEYEMQKRIVNKKLVESLIIINPRKLHPAQVKSIYKALLEGKHFDNVFVVNQTKGELRVIDGNHRVSALKLFFEKYPHKVISIYCATYTNLNDDQEREIFTRWNIGVSQNTDDFINSYKEVIPVYPRIVSEISCSVYGSYNKMKFRDLINAYIASFEKPYRGGESKTKLDLIQYIQYLVDSDADVIVKNFNIVKEVFDNGNRKDWRKQPAFKNIIFRALFYLVANNIDRLGEGYVKRRMRSVLVDRTILDDYRRYAGRRASVDAYLAFKSLLNDSQSDKKFI